MNRPTERPETARQKRAHLAVTILSERIRVLADRVDTLTARTSALEKVQDLFATNP